MGRILGQLAREAGRMIPARAVRAAAQPAALFFHGVETTTQDGRLQINHHEADMFRRILGRVARHFDVLPLSAIDAVLTAPHKYRRSVFLMSDDGYANTLSVAADILQELRLPWTLFVSTRYIDSAVPNPIFLARLFFLEAPDGRYALPGFEQPVILSPQNRDQIAAWAIDHLRMLPAEIAEAAVTAMRAAFDEPVLAERVAHFASERFLDWNGVRALKARGVEIGAHADSHWPMHARQSQAWLYQQTFGARARIEAEVGPCRFFAYPFGNTADIGPQAWKAVRDAGFTHAFTTLSGSLAAGGNQLLLPRYGIGPRDAHIAALVPLLRLGNSRLRHWQQGLALPEKG